LEHREEELRKVSAAAAEAEENLSDQEEVLQQLDSVVKLTEAANIEATKKRNEAEASYVSGKIFARDQKVAAELETSHHDATRQQFEHSKETPTTDMGVADRLNQVRNYERFHIEMFAAESNANGEDSGNDEDEEDELIRRSYKCESCDIVVPGDLRYGLGRFCGGPCRSKMNGQQCKPKTERGRLWRQKNARSTASPVKETRSPISSYS
jgi:hypothetical protein